MLSPSKSEVFCPTCGARLETTASGYLGCLACLLRAALEESPDGSGEAGGDIPDSLGSYLIERREDGTAWTLGQGTMGVTYRARDVSLQREVALKLIGASFSRHGSDARERFLREARAAASLRHPNVATIHQFGIDEETGRCYCAMELIEGETLEERVRRCGPLAVPIVREIARQITSALISAEEHGIVHRDLKPGNIMILASGDPAEITVKVIDFGLAKALGETKDARVQTDGGFLGTPAFASPEQLNRAPVDVRSDVYSLGVTLWYLLTGQLAFADGERGQPPVQQLKAAHVPGSLISLLLSMLVTQPAARPSAKEIARKLEAKSHNLVGATFVSAALILGLLAVAIYFSAAHPAPEPVMAVPAKSIAVLPFENLSDEKGSANFTDGVQDELLTKLARIADLKVVSRTSVMQYRPGSERNLREIGRQLGVAFIVEGAVHTIGRNVRISARLIDARSNLYQWAQSYNRPIDDVFAIQSEIAQTIAEQLDAKIEPREKTAIETAPTRDMIAFALNTQATVLLEGAAFSARGKQDLLEAAQLLAEAVARDPKFVSAWCQLARAHDLLYSLGYDRIPLRLSLGEAAVDAALKLQPEAGEAHLARARHLFEGYLAYDPALNELEIARRTLPNSPEVFTLAGHIWRREGKWDQSAQAFEYAVALDPRNVSRLQQLAISYNLQRQYPDAANVLDRALTVAPENLDLRVARAEVDLNWHANTRPMHELLAETMARRPGSAPDLANAWLLLALCERDQAATQSALAALGDGSFGPDALQLRRIFWEGLAARARGDTKEVKRAFEAARAEQERKVEAAPDFAPALSMLGLIDAGLGRKSEAIREGIRAVEMLPVTRDPINGAHLVEFLATIYAWCGEPALACDQLDVVTQIPGTLSYGQLRLSPMWDDLRGNPRFEKIVTSLAPDRR